MDAQQKRFGRRSDVVLLLGFCLQHPPRSGRSETISSRAIVNLTIPPQAKEQKHKHESSAAITRHKVSLKKCWSPTY